jgi:hypothetical protein
MTSETYPNGMTAYYTYNPVGQATALEYKKTAHCGEGCTWFSDTIVPSIHGETLTQTSTLSKEPSYTYDAAGRLTQVQEIPVGEGCTTRAYAYDEESNRRSQATYKPNSKGECATEEGTVQRHTYDEANRLTDEGVTYETFGNTTSLPASDAGESELTSKYYLDGQVYKQTQSEKTIEYKLDPADRTRETISKKGETETKAIAHYDAPGSAPAWTSEESGKKWTRNIPGIGGELAAIQTNSGTPTLQLHDLQGDIVATAAMSETETKLLTKYNSTEFGVPNSKEAPPPYAWLGALGVASEQPTGTITQDGITYVPQTGRALQTEGVPLPNPENTATPFVRTIEAWVGSRAGEGAARELDKAEQEQQAREAANMPPGSTPSLGGGGCDLETEGCAADPERGKNELGCSLKGSWGVEVEVNVELNCHVTPSASQIEIEIWRVEDGSYIEVMKKTHAWNWRRDSSYEQGILSCEPDKWYRAWVYGRVWAFSAFIWSDAYVLPQNQQCYEQGEGVEDPIEGEPGGAHSGEDGGGDDE